jgi:hypothetical protein
MLFTLALLAALLLLRLYAPLNTGPPRWILRTPLDARIPLVPVMVLPYLSLFAFAAATVAVLAAVSARLGQSVLVASILTLLVAYAFYRFARPMWRGRR